MLWVLCTTLNLLAYGDWLIPSEPLPHINHAALAFSIALLQLLATGGEGIDKGWPKAVYWFVPLYHDTVGILEANCQSRADVFAGAGHACFRGCRRGTE